MFTQKHKKRLVKLITFTFLLNLYAVKSFSTKYAADSTALMAIYNATDGPNWNNNTNWGTSAPLDQWFGITTLGTGSTVEEINLENNNLSGPFPNITHFQYLRKLSLSENNISGTIPSDLGQLIYLLDLQLDHNMLTGSIPKELGNLTQIHTLFLNHNQLSGPIPKELGNLTKLMSLDVQHNNLSEIPVELGNCKDLKWTFFSNNAISGEIPSALINLSSIIPHYAQNKFVFEDLKNAKSPASPPQSLLQDYAYVPQQGTYDQKESHIVMEGDSDMLSTSASDTHNTYQWYLNGSQINGAVNSTLMLNGVTPLDTGEYTLRIQNTVFKDLTLWREPIQVNLCQTDSCALMAIYNATDGPNWNNNTNWGTSAPLDQWFGVTTYSDGTVYKLDLSHNNLSGYIPTSIDQISALNEVFFTNNNISGTLPKELGNLQDLAILELSGNQISGIIPRELGQLQHLQTLLLFDNKLEGVLPKELCNTRLFNLSVMKNQLTGIESDFSNFNIFLFDIRKNRLSFEELSHINAVVPDYINQDYSYNQSDTIIGVFGMTDTLTIEGAKATGNQFQWYKDGAAITGATDSLYIINPITSNDAGTYTVEVTNSNFSGMTLYREPIKYDVLCDDRCVLMAIYNATDGPNWNSNTNWGTTAPLDQWHGVVTNPDGRVKAISLVNNNLNGTLPIEIGALDQVEGLNIWGNNNLSGAIPAEIGNLGNLEYLNLQKNDLTGNIPVELFNATNLVDLNLVNNDLSGPIPNEIGYITNLESLSISYNKFNGSIPDSIGNLVLLRFLSLNNNLLDGNIPECLGNLTEVTGINLSNNALTGKIPLALQNMAKLNNLDVANNQLSGVDKGLHFPLLEYIVVGGNRFDFEDLEILDGHAHKMFDFMNQSAVYNVPVQLQGIIGLNDTLTVDGATATGNQFQWYKDGTAITGATDSLYIIDPITLDHNGIYTVKVTNSNFGGVTLYREPIDYRVTVKPLPVILVDFDVEEQFGEVYIQWTTESEINADYFEVQRSEDGIHWNYVTTIAAHGNSNVTRRYETVDNYPLEGVSYYRLKQVDYNGVFEIFDPKAIEIKTEKLSTYTEVYPSPFKNELFIKLEGTKEQVNIQVFTIQGQLVHNQTIFGNGSHVVDIDNNLPTGIYLVSYQIEGEVVTKKVAKN